MKTNIGEINRPEPKDDIGESGMSGPASMTHFEIRDGRWRQEHVELENLCISVLNFIRKNPELVTKVEIQTDSIRSYMEV